MVFFQRKIETLTAAKSVAIPELAVPTIKARLDAVYEADVFGTAM
jgi:hypothetical protein